MDELKNALAWFRAAPGNIYKSGTENLQVMAQWIWEVIQGDFNNEQTTAQVVTGTVISMIPLVDQICDVRDLVANCKKINEDSSNKWVWVALVLTLIGLFPTLDSLAKGCLKILFAYGRKGVFRAGSRALDSSMWQATRPFVEAGIVKLNEFLARPAVRRTIAALKWENVYLELSKKVRALSSELNISSLLRAMDEVIAILRKLIDLVQRFGTAAMSTRAGQLLQMVTTVRNKADQGLRQALAPMQDWLNRLAQRLEVEHRLSYQGSTNAVNPHNFSRPSLDAEIQAMSESKPELVDAIEEAMNPQIRKSPSVPARHSDISDAAPRPLKSAFDTFHNVRPDILPPGTKIYRVLDPSSNDSSICWMTAQEFNQLRSKSDWCRRFAVWGNWNSNGEFVTYTVPAGSGLPVWRGKTASQQLRDSTGQIVRADKKGNSFWLEGGAEKLVIDPKHLDKKHLGPRQFTGWGYDEFGEEAGLIGVPILQHNWRD
ncbi:hypothetical protein [Pseudorhodoferax sp.]|uniref:hypothetical protein n=1 Tax=Pseudorhodoferax sp. TaxID=1993553 RepID=UPI0039E6E577